MGITYIIRYYVSAEGTGYEYSSTEARLAENIANLINLGHTIRSVSISV